MVLRIIVVIVFLSTLSLHAQNHTFEWVKQIGGTNYDTGRSIAIDSNNTIYTVGTFFSSANFDPGGENTSLTSLGDRYIFINS